MGPQRVPPGACWGFPMGIQGHPPVSSREVHWVPQGPPWDCNGTHPGIPWEPYPGAAQLAISVKIQASAVLDLTFILP